MRITINIPIKVEVKRKAGITYARYNNIKVAGSSIDKAVENLKKRLEEEFAT